jgi:hypothetical protein
MVIPGMFALRNRAAVLVLSVSILCALAPSPVSAQGKVKLPAIDVFGGYSYLRYESKTLGFADQMTLNGANVEVALPDLYEGLGAVVDLSGHYQSQMEEFNVMIGPQYTYEWKGIKFYGHGLFGKARDRLRQPGTTQVEPSSSGRAVALGGGVDFPLKGRLSVRAIQADYLITKDFGVTQHNVRLSTGLVYRFGKRE